jgi:hypothetical protein
VTKEGPLAIDVLPLAEYVMAMGSGAAVRSQGMTRIVLKFQQSENLQFCQHQSCTSLSEAPKKRSIFLGLSATPRKNFVALLP